MIFHIITSDSDNNQLRSLVAAATAKKLETNIIDAAKVSFAELPEVACGDLLLRVGVSERARTLEKYLFNPEAGHIYESSSTGVISSSFDAYYVNKRDGLPVINTVPLLPVSLSDLDSSIELLGGFPLVVKVNGDQNGVGVMKIDSKSSLLSVLDFIQPMRRDIWLREFVPHDYQARLVVVGDRVVGSMRNFPVGEDFRTNVNNAGGRNYEAAEFSEQMQATAVAAVHSVGRYFGGVDLLIANDGSYQIAEVNTPCGFSKTEEVSNCDVSGALIDFLITRSNSRITL